MSNLDMSLEAVFQRQLKGVINKKLQGHIMGAFRRALEEAEAAKPAPQTPSSTWHAEGAKDPHAGHYDGERASLTLGSYTDDQLANGAFMNYNVDLPIHAMLNPKPGQHMPIVWMTAVKDRIRWLSRSLEKALADSARLDWMTDWVHVQFPDGATGQTIRELCDSGKVIIDAQIAQQPDDEQTCSICKEPFDDGVRQNCGGDCLTCMADIAGDPDCVAHLKAFKDRESQS